MKIDDAKRLILSEWRTWYDKPEPHTWQDKFSFYNWLQHEKPYLLDFTCSGDKYQRISGWIG